MVAAIHSKFFLAIVALSTLASACALDRWAIRKVAEVASEGAGAAFLGEEDPELLGDALPFVLKLYETLLEIEPESPELLLATAQAFALYANAFVQAPAEMLGDADARRKQDMLERAARLYLRARKYVMRGIEIDHPGFADHVERGELETALALVSPGEIDYLYWAGASWMGAASAARFDLELILGIPSAVAMLQQALEWDESYDTGAIHEIFVSYYGGLPGEMGGSEERARHHFERAVALSDGSKASPYLALAGTVAVRNQNVAEFRQLLNIVLAIDPGQTPEYQLLNILARQKAQWMLDNIDTFFLLEDE